MMPGEPGAGPVPQITEEVMDPPFPPTRTDYRWYHKISAVLFITLCVEIGIFLMVFPWTEYWDSHYLSGLLPQLRNYWENFYFRGAVSGLGAVNLYIAFMEMFRLRRFSRH